MLLFKNRLTYSLESDVVAMPRDLAGNFLLLTRCMSGEASHVLAQRLNTAAQEQRIYVVQAF